MTEAKTTQDYSILVKFTESIKDLAENEPVLNALCDKITEVFATKDADADNTYVLNDNQTLIIDVRANIEVEADDKDQYQITAVYEGLGFNSGAEQEDIQKELEEMVNSILSDETAPWSKYVSTVESITLEDQGINIEDADFYIEPYIPDPYDEYIDSML